MKSNYFIVVLTVIILTVIFFLLFSLQNSSENEIISRFNAGQVTAVNGITREIKAYLGNQSQGTEVLSSFASIQYNDIKLINTEIQEFFDYVKHNYVKAISVYNAKGTIIYSTAKTAIGRNYSQADFFQWASKKENKRKQFISSLIQRTNNQSEPLPYFRFLIVSPIYQETKNPHYPKPSNKFMGIVTVTIDLKEVLSSYLPMVSPYAAKENVWIIVN